MKSICTRDDSNPGFEHRVGREVRGSDRVGGRSDERVWPVGRAANKSFAQGMVIGNRTTNDVLNSVTHVWLGGTQLHNPLARAATWAGYKVCFAAGTPICTPWGSQAIDRSASATCF